ncbi:MAG: HAD-IIA family hydrolase [Streptosporangiales bacterium]|nr:HAD-IIA family hydrolase [Streptosporangiales bacterium]
MRGCERPLAAAYDTALLDLDGVIYVGPRAVPEARPALDAARREGMRLIFVTNNSSRTPHAIAAHLRALGVPADATDIATSAQAAARLIVERVRAGSAVLVVGGTGLRHAVRAQGLRPVTTAAERPAAVAQGYSPDLTYGLLAEGALAVRGGALWVASNADTTLPTARGPIPGNGALAQVIRAATGRDPIFAGKPEPTLYREAMSRSGGSRTLAVGDRLETDIEGAVRAGMDSLLVLTGVTDPFQLVLAPPQRRPTYVARDLTGLLTAHPEVHRGRDGWQCRGWVASWQGDRLEVSGDGEPCDGLRALCAAAWAVEGPVPPAAVRDAVAALDTPWS